MLDMLTFNAHAATSATEPLTPTIIERSYAADEPAHIHIPRPSRVMLHAAEAAPLNTKEARR